MDVDGAAGTRVGHAAMGIGRGLTMGAAAAVLAAGLTGCARSADPAGAPSPATTPAPAATTAAATTAAATTPATVPSSADAPAVPASIPAAAFLQASDAEKGASPHLTDPAGTPAFCRATFASYRDIGIRTTSTMLWQHKDSPPGSTPAGTVTDTITVYRGDGATTFMADLRRAVAGCPSHQVDGITHRYRALGTVPAGQDSVLIEDSIPGFNEDGTPRSGRHYTYWGAARVGDSVTLVRNEGWEDASADRAESAAFTVKAARRLAAWRR
jgi:hypothetical protein